MNGGTSLEPTTGHQIDCDGNHEKEMCALCLPSRPSPLTPGPASSFIALNFFSLPLNPKVKAILSSETEAMAEVNSRPRLWGKYMEMREEDEALYRSKVMANRYERPRVRLHLSCPGDQGLPAPSTGKKRSVTEEDIAADAAPAKRPKKSTAPATQAKELDLPERQFEIGDTVWVLEMPKKIKSNETDKYEIINHWYSQADEEWQYVVTDKDPSERAGFGISVTETSLSKCLWYEGEEVVVMPTILGIKGVDVLTLKIIESTIDDGDSEYRGTFTASVWGRPPTFNAA